MTGHNPKGDAPESVPPLTSMPGVHPAGGPMGSPAGGRPFPARVTGPTSVYLGPVAHTWTSACAGHHPVSGPCPSSVTGYGAHADALRAEVDADNAKDAEIGRLRAELAALDAAYRQLDGLREVHWLARQAAEGERDKAREQLRQAREAFAKLAGRFTDTRQSGWTARVSGTVLRRLCVAAVVEPPDGSAQEAVTPEDLAPRLHRAFWDNIPGLANGSDFTWEREEPGVREPWIAVARTALEQP